MDVENLLYQVSEINKKYEEIANITGDNFNIFKILKIESSEVKFHSALLAELLNPKGSHGQKEEFLKAFIKNLQIENFEEPDITNCQVVVEEHNGKINEDYTIGGRIDIVIKANPNKVIVIENKINAVDQFNQLVRYKHAYPNGQILYLTLEGGHPSSDSIGDLKENEYRCISYSHDIIKWLEECRKKSVMFPMLRECISQYINLIKHLTHQSPNKRQEMEIREVLLSSQGKFG